MLNKITYLLILILGIALGSLFTWINTYTQIPGLSDDQELLEKTLAYSNTKMSDENNSCEGQPVKTVGAAVASLLELNTINSRNMLTYGCFNDTCSLSITMCTPWKDFECSSRFLKFNIDADNKILPSTFMCFDMP
jgi:hypothetical protein